MGIRTDYEPFRGVHQVAGIVKDHMFSTGSKQKIVAEAAQVGQGTISKLLNCSVPDPGIEVVSRLLGVAGYGLFISKIQID